MKVWAAALATGLFVSGSALATETAQAATQEASFAMAGTASFTGTATDATPVAIGVQVTQAELSPISPAGSAVTAPSGSVFLVVEVDSDGSAGTGPSFDGFDSVPTADVSLTTTSGVVAATDSGMPATGPLIGTYYFTVSPSITTAQLDVQAAMVSAVEYPGAVGANGKLTELTLAPTTIALVRVQVPATTITTPPTTVPAKQARHPRTTRSAAGLSVPGEIAIGAGGGGFVLLVVLVPIFIRRRRYDRADREGRVVIDAPPVLTHSPPPLPVPSATPIDDEDSDAGTVKVEVLGELEFGGLVRPIAGTPAQELLCYLALHPGRGFTTAELRNAIWAEPRTEPTAKTFRNYVWVLRKALPAETLDYANFHYRLTDAVRCDWGAFVAHTSVVGESRLAHLRSALALVRGRPFAGVGATDSYNWAKTEFSASMERAIEDATHELVTLALGAGDLDLAEWALSRWPPDPPWSVLLEGDSLRLAAARGGAGGVARAFEATRSHLGEDATLLEELASELGWVS